MYGLANSTQLQSFDVIRPMQAAFPLLPRRHKGQLCCRIASLEEMEEFQFMAKLRKEEIKRWV